MQFAEVISGIIALGLAILIFTTTRHFPALPGGMPGPALFPYIISGMLGLFSMMLIASGLLPSRGRGCLSEVAPPGLPAGDTPRNDGGRWETSLAKGGGCINLVLFILSMVLFVLLVEAVGFILTALILCVGLMWRLGVALAKAIWISAGTVMVIFWLFAKIMLVPLPFGVLRL